MDAGLLARAVNSLVEVNIWNTQLTQEQVKEIVTAVCSEGSPLKTLDTRWNDLSSIKEVLLATAVNSLEHVNLQYTELTRQQIKEILTAVCAGGFWLKNLNLSLNNMSPVEEGLLARAVNSLVEVSLDSTQLTRHQLDAIFTAIKAGQSQHKNLDVKDNNFFLVEPNLLETRRGRPR